MKNWYGSNITLVKRVGGSSMVVRIAVIGAGYMGSAHARVVRRIASEYPWSSGIIVHSGY